MDELIEKIAAKAGMDTATARKAVGIVVNFVAAEAPPDAVNELLDKMPGARDMLTGNSGGGGVMGVFGELTDIGLEMGGVQAVATEFIAYARQKAGDKAIDGVVNGIPGLSQFV